MIHIDSAEDRRPLPLRELPDLEAVVQPICAMLVPERGNVATADGHICVTLYTDSDHLRSFFRGNWGGCGDDCPSLAEATIVALRSDSVPGAKRIIPGYRYVNPSRTLILSVKNEYYGNVKISVRGLCSSAARRLRQGGFLHGAAMAVGDVGIVIAGASGAGKTTTVRALFDRFSGVVRIINDDWGWGDQDGGILRFTGEPNLHMKYRSVRTVAPTLEIFSSLRPSENFVGDVDDPHARLLIPRHEVFDGAVSDQASFSAFAVVVRDLTKPFFARLLTPEDVPLLEQAEYSAFYQRNERFMDGSLLLVDDEDVAAERERFRRLLNGIPSLLVNNVSTPSAAAVAIEQHLEQFA